MPGRSQAYSATMQTFLSERVFVLLALLLAGIALFLTTLGAEYQQLGAAQSPVFFPRIILGIWIALTLIALVQEKLVGDIKAQPLDKGWMLLVFVVATLVYVNSVTRLGFMLSSIPFALISLWIFGLRNKLGLVVYAILVPGSLVVLFNHILSLPLPTSPFTYLL